MTRAEPWPLGFASAADELAWAQAIEVEPGRLRREFPDVLYLTTWLGPGGVPRNLVDIARGAVRRGARVDVVTRQPLVGAGAHFAEELRAAGVDCRQAAPTANVPPERWINRALAALPPALDRPVRRIVAPLIASAPALLHCFLDVPNVLGGLAGLATGCRGVVLSLGSLRPTEPQHVWTRDWYRLLARSPRVALVANCQAVADDYAAWLTLPRSRIDVVRNGFDSARFRAPDAEARAQFRASLGIPESGPLLAGGFRLRAIKRPLDFVEVVARLRGAIPGLHAVLAGVGDAEPELRSRRSELGLEGVVHLLGARTDMALVLGASDVLLHTARSEGCPNVLIEAQWLGVPVVATRVGGASEAVCDGASAILCGVGDIAAQAEACRELLADPERRERMGRVGHRHVAESFEVSRVLPEWWAVYARLTGDSRWR